MCIYSDNFCLFGALDKSHLYVSGVSLALCAGYFTAAALILLGM